MSEVIDALYLLTGIGLDGAVSFKLFFICINKFNIITSITDLTHLNSNYYHLFKSSIKHQLILWALQLLHNSVYLRMGLVTTIIDSNGPLCHNTSGVLFRHDSRMVLKHVVFLNNFKVRGNLKYRKALKSVWLH